MIVRAPQPLRPIYQGESRVILVTAYYEDTGLRRDLTTATGIRAYVVATVDGDNSPSVLAKTLGGGITLRDQTDPATTGDALIALAPADTLTLAPGIYYWRCWVDWPDGNVSLIVPPESKFPVRGA